MKKTFLSAIIGLSVGITAISPLSANENISKTVYGMISPEIEQKSSIEPYAENPDDGIRLCSGSIMDSKGESVLHLQTANKAGNERVLAFGYELTAKGKQTIKTPTVKVAIDSATVNAKPIDTPYPARVVETNYNFHGSLGAFKYFRSTKKTGHLQKNDTVRLNWSATAIPNSISDNDTVLIRSVECRLP